MKKNLLIGAAMTTTLVLAACGSDEEQSKAYGEVVHSSTTANPQLEESKYPIVYLSKDYREITKTLKNFELPEEGRLSNQKAEERFGESVSVNAVAYDNGYVFDKESKALKILNWGKRDLNTDEPPNPKGTQVLGLFMTSVSSLSDAHKNIQGEVVDVVGDITEEDRDLMEWYILGQDYDTRANEGWGAIQAHIDKSLYGLNRVQPFIEDENISAWIEETKEYFKKAQKIAKNDLNDWEEAYKYYKEGTLNFDKMNLAIKKANGNLL